MTNPHKDLARLNKAIRIADWFDNTAPEFVDLALADDGKVMKSLDRDWWLTLAQTIGVKPPSLDTVDQVIDLLRRRRAPVPDASELFGDEVVLRGCDRL